MHRHRDRCATDARAFVAMGMPVPGVRNGFCSRDTQASTQQEPVMPRGSKESYTGKQKRQAEHIEEGYEDRGVSKNEAERRAWATVNKTSGGGRKSGSGRGKTENEEPSRAGGRKGGAAPKSPAKTRRTAKSSASTAKAKTAKPASARTGTRPAATKSTAKRAAAGKKTTQRKKTA
jgi:plasmid stabilization system protein ParE